MNIDIQLSHLNKASNRRLIHKNSKKVDVNDVNDVNIGRVKVMNDLLSLEEFFDFIVGKLKLIKELSNRFMFKYDLLRIFDREKNLRYLFLKIQILILELTKLTDRAK